ncbi:MAG: hypothetical protein WDZ91_08075 [Paenibacillaceae bacterium]
MINESTIKRLAFVKYLYELAINQSRQQEPLSSASILMFHDSIELFLYIACEYKNARNNNPNFLDYWDILNPKLNTELSQKESMKRLNKSRVSLKHHGTMPSRIDIEAIRASVTNFFDENCPIIFEIEFNKISLINLIECIQTKECLEEASSMMINNKYSDAIIQIGLSFQYLIDDYESKQHKVYGKSPFFFGQDFTFEDSFNMHLQEEKLSQFVDKVQESIQSIQSAIKIVSLGIDYRRYIKFRLLTPKVTKLFSGKYVSDIITNRGELGYSEEDQCKYCINFVIDSALKLQEDVGIPEK